MKTVKPWVSTLGVDPKDYHLWAEQVPQSALTFWCLEKDKIPVNKYLSWAREHYGLAVLKDNFFSEPANHEFWNIIKSVANWSSSMVPLTEWDGVVFVACVEPPSEVNWSFPVRYLLASADNLKSYWAQLQNPSQFKPLKQKAPVAPPTAPVKAVQPTPPQVVANEPVQPVAPPPPVPSAAPVVVAQASQPVAPPPAPEAPIALELADGLEGLNLNLAGDISNSASAMPEGFNLNFGSSTSSDSNSGDPFAALKLSIPDEPSTEAATGLSLAIDTSTHATSATRTQMTQSSSEMVIVGGMESMAPDEDDETPHHLDAISDEEAVQSAGPRPEREFKAFEDSVVGQSPMESTFAGSISGIRVASPEDAVIDIKQQAPVDIAEAANENEAAAWAFKTLKETFNQSMILLFEGENVRPWKWEKAWAPRGQEAFAPFSLSKPGIFRIVKRTNMPYHGHVVPSEANQQFFLAWGLANLPAHATIVPMCVGNQAIGVLLCIGETTANTPQTLMTTDRIAGKLTDRLSRFSKAA